MCTRVPYGKYYTNTVYTGTYDQNPHGFIMREHCDSH